MVHMRSEKVIYRAQIAHAYWRRINEELRGRFLLLLLLLLSYEQKTNVRNISGCSASTTENSAQLIFQFRIMSTFRLFIYTTKNLLPQEPSWVSLDDAIPSKMSYSPLYKFRSYTGLEIKPNRNFNG